MKVIIKTLANVLLIFLINISYAKSENIIRLGLLVPITGEHSYIGKSVIQSVRMGINKINNKNIIIFPRDTKSNPEETFRVVEELYNDGIRIFIGPIFKTNTENLNKFQDATFLSLTNKTLDNPSNVISTGINAKSQFEAIKKYLELNELNETLVLIPKKEYKEEIEDAIIKSKTRTKKIFYYDAEPTELTKQIEKVTRYDIRKRNLEDEIKRVEESDDPNKERKVERLKKKDTLGRIGFDSIVIADFDESLKSVATSLLYTDVSPKKVSFISLNQWFNETLFREKSSQPISFPSINFKKYNDFKDEYNEIYNQDPSQISILSYDLVGLVYYLLIQNDFEVDKKLFSKKNKFKGISGTFEIKNNQINHILNFYSVEENNFKEIF